jgi:hypothetical protein
MKQRICAVLFASACLIGANFQPARAASGDTIGGAVKSAAGPEAGVWVIAETADLPTKFVKIVVTDDQGRYLLPELPKAKYKVWVRGYGLVDSDPVDASPGAKLDLTAKVAPSARDAAQYYPANYWYALLEPPPKSDFPGTGAQGNGIAPAMLKQQDWLAHMKENCLYCHQIGDKATRELPPTGSSSVEGWAQRIQMARAAGDVTVGNFGKDFSAIMQNNMAHYGRERGLKMFAGWTDRIAAGEIPPKAPARPQGVERNVVLTEWDWAGGNFVHDEITTDKRSPTVNANGPVYGTDDLNGHLVVLDPVTAKPGEVDIPGLDKAHNIDAGVHNPMIDQKGRVWMSDIRGEGANPDFCTDGTKSKYAKLFPTEAKVGREIVVYDPSSKKMDIIPTCFGTHHLQFAWDNDNTLYFSGDTNVIGWIDTKIWDETHDPAKAEGWCPLVLDTSGDGKMAQDRTAWIQPKTPGATGEGATEGGQDVKVDANAKSAGAKDTRINGFLYAMGISPKDQSIWIAKYSPAVPSGLVRMSPGKNPPETCSVEYYEPPKLPSGDYAAFNMRGVDLDSNGVAWAAFGSGQLGRFDRSKCKVLNGPTATGQQCPEGWTFYDSPGPKVKGTTVGTADWHYMTWVDQQNVLGLGKDVPILPGTMSDSLIAFEPKTGKQVVLRVPYPMNFYTRGMDGRIDDPKAGWKGRGLWADYGGVPLWHTETGEGTLGKIVKFQLRENPLQE